MRLKDLKKIEIDLIEKKEDRIGGNKVIEGKKEERILYRKEKRKKEK